MLESSIDHSNTEISSLKRRTTDLENKHQTYINTVQRLGDRIIAFQRDIGSKIAELMGRIDTKENRLKQKSYTDRELQPYSGDDVDEISGCFDNDILRNKARAQRAKARKMRRMAQGLPPAVAVLAVTIWELIQHLMRK